MPHNEIDTHLINLFSEFKSLRGKSDIETVIKRVSQLQRTPYSVPERGLGIKETTAVFTEHILPFLSHTVSDPYYFGYVIGGATEAACIGDIFCTLTDQNTALFDGTSIAPVIEEQTVSMIKNLFDIPENFNGLFTTGATASNILGMLCAREHIGQLHNISPAEDGMAAFPATHIYGNDVHESVRKALSVAGFGRRSFIELADQDMASDVLEKKLLARAGKAVVVATLGKVNTGACDPLEKIGSVCRKYNAWLHVDGAFGLFAAASPEYKHLTKGIHYADSISVDMHKWLNVPYDCALFLTRHLTYLEAACHSKASYMGAGTMPDGKPFPMNIGIENSRRFRALAVFFSLLAYGKQGIAEQVQEHCNIARALGQKISQSPDYDLLCDVTLNIVLFSLKNRDLTEAFIKTVNEQTPLYLSKTIYQGATAARIAVCNHATQGDIADSCIEILEKKRMDMVNSLTKKNL